MPASLYEVLLELYPNNVGNFFVNAAIKDIHENHPGLERDWFAKTEE